MIYYEVWGRDTFAGETYLCGRYTSRKEASRICKKNEDEVAKSQDLGLRDTFWVVEISDKEIEERRIRDEQIDGEKYNERSYDSGRLRNCTSELMKQFGETLKGVDVSERLKYRTDEVYFLITKQELSCKNRKDCFNKLVIELFHCGPKWPYRISNTISFNGGYRYSGGDCSQAIRNFDTMDEVFQWLNDDNSQEDVYKHLCKLIDSFYDE